MDKCVQLMPYNVNALFENFFLCFSETERNYSNYQLNIFGYKIDQFLNVDKCD